MYPKLNKKTDKVFKVLQLRHSWSLLSYFKLEPLSQLAFYFAFVDSWNMLILKDHLRITKFILCNLQTCPQQGSLCNGYLAVIKKFFQIKKCIHNIHEIVKCTAIKCSDVNWAQSICLMILNGGRSKRIELTARWT